MLRVYPCVYSSFCLVSFLFSFDRLYSSFSTHVMIVYTWNNELWLQLIGTSFLFQEKLEGSSLLLAIFSIVSMSYSTSCNALAFSCLPRYKRYHHKYFFNVRKYMNISVLFKLVSASISIFWRLFYFNPSESTICVCTYKASTRI